MDQQPVPENNSNNVTPLEPLSPTPDVVSSTPGMPPPAPLPPTPPVKSSLISKLKSKPIIIALIAVGVLFVGSAAAYVGVIVPNKPENLWNKALSNSAKAYDKLIDYSDTQKDVKGYKVSGNFKIEGEFSGDGNFDIKGYEDTTSAKLDFGYMGQRLKLDVLTDIPDNAKSPDIYVNATGIKGLPATLGLDNPQLANFVNTLEGRWIYVDHTLVDSMLPREDAKATSELTNDDLIAIARAVGDVNREYLFSSDTSKNPIRVKKMIGKEVKEGRSTYHYQVEGDDAKFEAYLNALRNRLKQTKLKDIYGEKEIDKFFDDLIASGKDSSEGIEETNDVWIDTKTKMFRFIELHKTKPSDELLKIEIPYDGGKKYPLNLSLISTNPSGATSMSMKTSLDSSTNKVDLSFNASGPGDSFKVSGSAKGESSNEKIEFTKPANAMTVTELMELYQQALGGVLGASTDGSNSLPLVPFLTQ